jgi:catechol 2,3-dioxygenase-like lactoylglutathione lyase family enzyme
MSWYEDPNTMKRVTGIGGIFFRVRDPAVDPKIEEYDYGRFAWIMDPEGNRVELWEPRPNKSRLALALKPRFIFSSRLCVKTKVELKYISPKGAE